MLIFSVLSFEFFRKPFNQFTMSYMFCDIMCYEISFPLFFPLSVLVMPYGKIMNMQESSAILNICEKVLGSLC